MFRSPVKPFAHKGDYMKQTVYLTSCLVFIALWTVLNNAVKPRNGKKHT